MKPETNIICRINQENHEKKPESIFIVVIISVKKSVSAPERKSNEAPRFVELLQGKNASDGDPVSLQCRIAGIPDLYLAYI